MKTTLDQRLDSFQLHMEQREEHLTPEENREFLVRAIDHLQGMLNKANLTPSPQDFQEALNILAKHRDDGYNDMAGLEWLNKMSLRGIFPTYDYKSPYDNALPTDLKPDLKPDALSCPYNYCPDSDSGYYPKDTEDNDGATT